MRAACNPASTPARPVATPSADAVLDALRTVVEPDSGRDLVDFAYRSPAHVETIARTEPSGWYSEELFARFAVLEVEGTHRGRVP